MILRPTFVMPSDRSNEAILPDAVATLFGTVGVLVAALDREGRIVHVNKTCEWTIGFCLAELRGKPAWELIHIPGERASARSALDRGLRWAVMSHRRAGAHGATFRFTLPVARAQ